MTDQPTLRPVITPAEHCGQWSPGPLGARTECVLRPDHSGSHADDQGGRWWPNPARTTPDNPATSSDTTDGCCVCGGGPVVYRNYREQPFCWPCADCGCNQDVCVRTGINDPAVSAVRDRDMRVLADEITRLSAITGQLRTLATRWQATVRPGETHPAAAAILGILDGDGPSVADCAADDRRWFDGEKAGER